MKDEIKEILDKLKDSVTNSIDTEVDQFTQEAYDVPNYFCLDPTTNDCKVLSDYITNLQTIEQQYSALLSENAELENENERLKEENKRIFSKVNDDELLISNAMNYAEAQDYKSRNEKAGEMIRFIAFNSERPLTMTELNKVYYILQGSDKDD